MSSNVPQTPSKEPTQMELKQDARDARLSLKKTQEEVYRKRFQSIALRNCETEIKAFGACTNREGFMVIFNCRKESKASKYLYLS